MQYTSLKHIVKSVLNQKGYTIHWYYQYLKLAADCFRELHFDHLRIIQTKKLEVNTEDNSVTLPCDYVDFVKVGIPYGQLVRPLVQASGINRLNNFDSNGQVAKYGSSTEDTDRVIWNSGKLDIVQDYYGEHIGRLFGFRTNNMADGFKEIKERGVIQLSEDIAADYIILEYISDGTGLTDSAAKVDPYAQRAIETYIEWKSTPNRNNINSVEAQQHWAAVRILKGRKNSLTLSDIRRILSRSKQAGPK